MAGITVGPHVLMDESNGPLVPGVIAGGTVTPLLHPVQHFGARIESGTAQAAGASAQPSYPEAFGFIENGEVTSGDWQSDLQFPLISTIAYFAIDVNPDG